MTTSKESGTNQKRVLGVDFLRGVVMIIMALDHVRDFFHESAMTSNPLDLSVTTPQLFFTRWITHFCAPTFVFLSGLSAYLSATSKGVEQTSSFLLKRGIWLIIVDAIIMSFALTFNPSYNFVFLTVLWAIGCSMVLLGLILKLSPGLVLPIGLVLFFGHNLFSFLSLPPAITNNDLLKVLFTGNYVTPAGVDRMIGFFYAILPWTGVMCLGYWFGKHIHRPKLILSCSIFLLILFVVLRTLNEYGDPVHWIPEKNGLYTFLSFINTTKYPPSLLFLSMTIGPALLLLLVRYKETSAAYQFISTYGKVPFFYFVSHFFLAHLILVAVYYVTGHNNSQVIDPLSPFYFRPAAFGFSLPIVYAIWFSVVLLLYYPCKSFYKFKTRNKKWWVKYL